MIVGYVFFLQRIASVSKIVSTYLDSRLNTSLSLILIL